MQAIIENLKFFIPPPLWPVYNNERVYQSIHTLFFSLSLSLSHNRTEWMRHWGSSTPSWTTSGSWRLQSFSSSTRRTCLSKRSRRDHSLKSSMIIEVGSPLPLLPSPSCLFYPLSLSLRNFLFFYLLSPPPPPLPSLSLLKLTLFLLKWTPSLPKLTLFLLKSTL